MTASQVLLNFLLCCVQVFAIVVFDKMESYLLQVRKLTPGRSLRLITRSLYVGKLIKNFITKFLVVI